MAAPGLDEVMAFLTDHGFAGAASALRDDVRARTAAGDAGRAAALDPQLPPLRMPGTASGGVEGGATAPASPRYSSGSASSSAFVSMRSSPSGLLNPYGLWSPRHSQSDASSSEMEFGTARQYDNTDLFFQEGWLYDDHLFPSKLDDGDHEYKEEDKFVLGAHGSSDSDQVEMGKLGAGHYHRHDHVGSDNCEGCAEVYTCSSPLCGCCGGGLKNGDDLEMVRSSTSTLYERYQIIDDQTEIQDDCAHDGFQLKQPEDVILECGLLRGPALEDDRLEQSVVEKELQMLSSFDTDADVDPVSNHGVHDVVDIDLLNGGMDKNMKSSCDKEYLKQGHRIQPFPESSYPDDSYDFGDIGSLNADVQHSTAPKAEDDSQTNIDLALSNFQREYEVFELRIIHRKNRTGFEENKDFPIVLNSVIAGRYYVTEYLGSAAFSKVVQAHDLQTGMDVCLKIIKNDKDFFDQSLDEIKLLKFVNKYDPLDEHHVLRLYDYFYYQEHLFIVTELLRANLYEFQKYNEESGGEVYFTLPRIQVLFPNEPVSIMLAQMIGIIGPIDMEMLELGQEAHKYFTDDYDLFTKNEETDQLEYLIPEKSSLRRHLQYPDSEFVDFLSYLLQINPRKRPTADEALQHPWLSSAY
ncbi:hypothetical protein PR202_gb04318 [Eleusine coracana subsp. coracana]|uniref:Protein kinase domain-containing protein n=1 Tax=Eleusine coracana subsp. coracana TaxID=191504 RepID=A0AAV5E1T9_ELECO|nr:hypothetical protein PR202_gb04318 [Eleusine coracana subsp. coracana]